MPKTLEKDEKIKSILDRATELFAQKGYHDVTMEEIASTVGVAKGTLYLYFPSKEELYWGILERGLHELFAHFEEEARRLTPPEEKLKAFLAELLKHSRQNSQFYRLLIREETTFTRTCQELLAPWRDRAFQFFRQILGEGIDKGAFRPHDTYIHSVILPGMVRSVILFYEGEKNEEAIIQEMLDLILYGLKGGGREG